MAIAFDLGRAAAIVLRATHATARHDRRGSPIVTRPIRVLELRSVRGTGGGPEKTILLGAARSDPARVAVTVCYIRDARDQVFAIGERARALGVDYVEPVERGSFDPRILAAAHDGWSRPAASTSFTRTTTRPTS